MSGCLHEQRKIPFLQGLGFRIYGFDVEGLGFRVLGLGVEGLGFRVFVLRVKTLQCPTDTELYGSCGNED